MQRFIIFVIAFITLHLAMGTKSGMKLYVSEAGMDGLLKIVVSDYGNSISNVTIDDQKGQHKAGIFGNYEWNIKNIKIRGIQKPSSNARYEHGTVRWKLTKANFDIKADWGVQYHPSILTSTGQLTLRICLTLDASFTFGDGTQLILASCNTPQICGSEATVHDSHKYPPWLQKIINSLFTDTIATQVQRLVCPQMKEDLQGANLYSFRETVFSADYNWFMINVEPVGHIQIGDKWSEAEFSGEVTTGDHDFLNDNNPMEAPALPITPRDSSKMGQLMFTSYPFSTMLYSSVKSGVFNRAIIPTKLPVDQGVYFATTCIDMCIGKYIPELSKKYPKSFVNVYTKPTDDIHVYIKDGEVLLNLIYLAEFFINGTQLFRLQFPVNVTIVPYNVEDTFIIRSNLTSITTGQATLSTNMHMNNGDLPQVVMNTLMNVITNVQIKGLIKEISKKDLNLSLIFSGVKAKCARLTMKNVELHVRKGYIALLLDATHGVNKCRD